MTAREEAEAARRLADMSWEIAAVAFRNEDAEAYRGCVGIAASREVRARHLEVLAKEKEAEG